MLREFRVAPAAARSSPGAAASYGVDECGGGGSDDDGCRDGGGEGDGSVLALWRTTMA